MSDTDGMPRPVLIAGGSFAGLACARQLARRQVPCIVLERAPADRLQRHRFRFHDWSYDPLTTVLGCDLTRLKQETAVDARLGQLGSPDSVSFDPKTGNFIKSQGGDTSFRANRGLLTDLLRKGLDIRFSTQVERYESRDDHVLVYLSDGTNIEASALIAADGVHSKIRNQACPDASFTILEHVAYYSQQYISRDRFAATYGQILDGTTKLDVSRDGRSLALSINEITDAKAKLAYTYSRKAEGREDPLLRPARALDKAHDIPDEYFDELATIGKDLPEPLKSLCDRNRIKADGDHIVHWLQRSLQLSPEQLEFCARQRVAFIGDSAHPMPILVADGANHALVDGLHLGEILDLGEPAASITTFNVGAASRWNKGLETAMQRLQAMHG